MEWKRVKIGDCLVRKPEYGLNAAAVEFSNNLPAYLRITDISDEGRLLSDKRVSVKHDNSHEYFLDDGDVVFARTGASVGKTYMYKENDGPLVYAGFLIRMRTDKNKLDPKFLFAYTHTEKYYQWVKEASPRSGQPGLNSLEYTGHVFSLPPLPEQKRIVKVLGTWDRAVEVLRRKIELKKEIKKGLMQELLTGKTRRPGFSGEWRSVQLGAVAKRIRRKNINNDNILTISGQHGLVSQSLVFKKRIAADNLENYLLLSKGDFAYNKSYSNGYPMGAIKRLKNYQDGVVSSLYVVFHAVNIDQNFLDYYFENGLFNRELSLIAHEGARNHGLLNVSAEDFFSADIYVPVDTIEQKAIADVLAAADADITLLEKKLALLEDQKKYLLNTLITGMIRTPEHLK